jgi:hypothetical protein
MAVGHMTATVVAVTFMDAVFIVIGRDVLWLGND